MSLKTWVFGGAICIHCKHHDYQEASEPEVMVQWPGVKATMNKYHYCLAIGCQNWVTGIFHPDFAKARNPLGHCWRFQPKTGDTEP